MTANVRRSAALAALCVLALGACDTSLEPTDIAGTYVYAPPSGLRFSIPVSGTPQNFTLRIVDTLVFRTDGTARISGVSSWETPPPGQPSGQSRSVAFIYRINDRRIEASATTPNVCVNPYSPCVWTFRILGDQLIHENGAATQYLEVYTRVGPPTP